MRDPSPDTLDGPAPAVSVIIPHYNDLANLDRCLALLRQQTFAPFETIVVDNASPMPLETVASLVAGRAMLLSCLEKGAGPARNAGIASAKADRLAFIDSDCRPEPGWLAAGVAALERWDFLGGHVKVDVEDPDHMTPVEAYESVFAFRFKDYIEKKGFTGSGNLFAHRSVFEMVGGFKAAVAEDVEWSHRARAGGFSLGYEPLAVVGHPARRTWEEMERKWRRMNREDFLLAAAQPGGALKFVLRNWLVLASILPKGREILFAPALRGWQDRLAAFTILAKVQWLRFHWAHQNFFRTLLDKDADA